MILRKLYGDTPLHLLAHLASFALAGYAIVQLAGVQPRLYLVGWFVGAIVLHDFVLLPAYALLDRGAARSLPRGAVNHLRVPFGLSALLLLAFFPVMFDKGEGAYQRVSGLTYDGYLVRWLIATAVLFALSGLVYLVRSRGARSAGSSS